MAFNPDEYLAQKEAPAAQSQGFDPDAYLASKNSPAPAPEGKSLAGLGANALKDTGEIASGVANLAGNMIEHPIDTSSQMVKGLPGAIGAWAKELGIPEALHGQFGDAVSKFGNSAYEHPVSRALDVASIALPALKGAGILDAGAKGAELASDAAKAGGAGEMLTDASNALGRHEFGFTKRLINTEDKLGKANDTIEWANKKGLMDMLDSPEDRLGKVKAAKDAAWDTMGKTYSDPALAGKSLNAQKLVDDLNGMRPRDATGNLLTGGDYEAINKEIDQKIATIAAHKGDIPWSDAQTLKNTMKNATKWELTQPTTINDLRKRMSGTFRNGMEGQLSEQLGKDNPAMGNYTAAKNDYGMAKNAIRALDNRISSSAGNRLGGATDWLAAAAGGAHGGPLGALAVVAGKKLVERYGLSAGSKVLSQLAGGRYAPLFSHMATFGPAELQTIHMIASQDPQFAQELSQAGGNPQ